MSDAGTEAVLDRIAKLLALTEARGATEAEAHIANEHVQRLLQEHNLTLSQVESRSGQTEGGKRQKGQVSVGADELMRWQTDLIDGVASSNFCLAASRRSCDGKRYYRHAVIVGRAINVTATQMMYDYLLGACRREMQGHGFSMSMLDGSYFCSGMTQRIVARLKERRAEREAESAARAKAAEGSGSHREMVLSDVYGSEADLNNDFLNGFPTGTTAAKRREGAERSARQCAEHKRLVASGVDRIVAWYRAYGYSEERATSLARSWRRSQRRGGRGGSARNWSSSNRAEYKKINSAAFQAGLAAGAAVSLDEQVGAGRANKLTSK